MKISEATLAELAEELAMIDAALAIGVRVAFYTKYRQFIMAEIDRRCPISPDVAAMSDAELLASLDA